MGSWDGQLPFIRMVNKTSGLQVEMHGSIRLHLSSDSAHLCSETDITKLVNEDDVWLARTGSCKIIISLSIAGELVCGKDIVLNIINWVVQYELWERLGVSLRYCGETSPIIASNLLFWIQHPDLSSSFVAPSCVPVAEFKSVSYSIDISQLQTALKSKRRSSSRKRSAPKTNNPATEPRNKKLNAVEPWARDEFYDCLNDSDQQAIDDFVRSLGLKTIREEQAGSNNANDNNKLNSVTTTWPENLQDILQTCIQLSIIGSGRYRAGFRIQESDPAYAMAKIAPGVFNTKYLKKLMEGTSLIPTITDSLMGMVDAESQSLREKMQNLAQEQEQETVTLADKLEGIIWRTLITHTKFPTINVKSVKKNIEKMATPENKTSLNTGLVSSQSTDNAEPASPEPTLEYYQNPLNDNISFDIENGITNRMYDGFMSSHSVQQVAGLNDTICTPYGQSNYNPVFLFENSQNSFGSIVDTQSLEAVYDPFTNSNYLEIHDTLQ